MKKKIFAGFLTLCMISSMIPVSASAGGGTPISEAVKLGEMDQQNELLSEDGSVDGAETNAGNVNEILEECEEIGSDGSSMEIKAGQMASLPTVKEYNGFKVAITNNGSLYCWGDNRYGQVGNGSTESQLTPVKVLENVISVSIYSVGSAMGGYISIAAITNNGDLYCWGSNGYGQVGNGSTNGQTVPIKVLSNVKSFNFSDADTAFGEVSVAAITNNGDLYCWGSNGCGQAGDENTEKQTRPKKILENVVSVELSSSMRDCVSIAAITESGDLYCWGYNAYGQVGNGNTEDQAIPIKVLSDVKSVSLYNGCWWGSVAAITNAGDLYCWGYNAYGQVGNGSTENQTVPIKVLDNVLSVSIYDSVSIVPSGGSASTATVAAVTNTGDLYCWGYNAYGQVGNGSTEDQTTPVKVLSDIASVFVPDYNDGQVSVAAIAKNKDLYCWGCNTYGQVGNGSTENQTIPVKILSNVTSFTSEDSFLGRRSVAALTDNRDLYCWGYNESGQAGNGNTENQLIPEKVLSDVTSVSISEHNSGMSVAALTDNGDLYCWGDNEWGQIGNGNTENCSTPIKVLENVVSVSCYDTAFISTAAITDNGDLYCWGSNSYGQVGNGSMEDQTTPIIILNLMSGIQPTEAPSGTPGATPIVQPTSIPSGTPAVTPIIQPTSTPSGIPTATPTVQPTDVPSNIPDVKPTIQPTNAPTGTPNMKPTIQPTDAPAKIPSATEKTVTWTGGPLRIPVDLGGYRAEDINVSLRFAEIKNMTYMAKLDGNIVTISSLRDFDNYSGCLYQLFTKAGDHEVELMFDLPETRWCETITISIPFDNDLWDVSEEIVKFDGSRDIVFDFKNGTNAYTLKSISRLGLFIDKMVGNLFLQDGFSFDMKVGKLVIDRDAIKNALIDHTNKNGIKALPDNIYVNAFAMTEGGEEVRFDMIEKEGLEGRRDIAWSLDVTGFKSAQASQQKSAQTIKNKYSKTIEKQVGSKLTQRVTGADTEVTFRSLNTKVARVGKKSGVITCVGVGKAVIVSEAAESSKYKMVSKRVTILVIPKTAEIKSIKSKKKGWVTIKSDATTIGNDGYKIQYKHNGKTDTVKIVSKKALTKTFKNLRSGKAFKARICAYKKVDGKVYYGDYSKWKTVKKVR
ncbi:MAG: hypothetical protein HFH54_06895 [Lachnospiraceae bacterium]|nr:hypothetical protein [Lachnospiraceae bacterium]